MPVECAFLIPMTEKRHRSSREGDQQQNGSSALVEVEAPQKFTYLQPPPAGPYKADNCITLHCARRYLLGVSPDFVGPSPSNAGTLERATDRSPSRVLDHSSPSERRCPSVWILFRYAFPFDDRIIPDQYEDSSNDNNGDSVGDMHD